MKKKRTSIDLDIHHSKVCSSVKIKYYRVLINILLKNIFLLSNLDFTKMYNGHLSKYLEAGRGEKRNAMKLIKRNIKHLSVHADDNVRITTVPLKPQFIQKCGRYCSCSNSKNVYFCQLFLCFLKTRNAPVTFAENPQMKINSLKKQKH